MNLTAPTSSTAGRTLTPRQLDVLSMIVRFRHLNGYSPLFLEIGKEIGIKKCAVLEHVTSLERKGYIRKEKGVARSIEVLIDPSLPNPERLAVLQVLGDIAAGEPIKSVETREELDLAKMFNAPGGVSVLIVRGDGFLDQHICDGDRLVVERQKTVAAGQRVVLEDEDRRASVGRFDPAVRTLSVIGAVVGLLRTGGRR